MDEKTKILICGILPPPLFGHSAMYKILMESSFVDAFDITFLDMRFWSYAAHGKVGVVKLLKMIKYYFQFVFLLIVKRPRYVLYNMSFDKMPFLKDFLFCFTGRVFGRRIIIHDMGQYVKELYDSSSPVFRAMIRWMLKNATACIMLGEGTKTVYNGFIVRERLFCVPGSVEDSISIKAERRAGEQHVHVLYFSYMAKSKGVFTAFKAAAKVMKDNDTVKFTFAGPIENDLVRQGLDDLTERFTGRVKYLGYIEDAQMRTQLLRNADIFIFPTHRDVFGLVLLHAMAEGLPAVASVEGSVPEIIIEGENGFLFPKGDDMQLARHILRLAQDDTLRKTMGRANRERYASVYAPNHYGRNMIKTFEEIDRLT